jgi:hypothetical protein
MDNEVRYGSQTIAIRGGGAGVEVAGDRAALRDVRARGRAIFGWERSWLPPPAQEGLLRRSNNERWLLGARPATRLSEETTKRAFNKRTATDQIGADQILPESQARGRSTRRCALAGIIQKHHTKLGQGYTCTSTSALKC